MSVYRPLPIVTRREVTGCGDCRWDNSEVFYDMDGRCHGAWACGVNLGAAIFGTKPGEYLPTHEDTTSGECPRFTRSVRSRIRRLFGRDQPEYIVEVEVEDAQTRSEFGSSSGPTPSGGGLNRTGW